MTQRLHEPLARGLDAAHDLDDDVHIRVGKHRLRVGGEVGRVNAGTLHRGIAHQHGADLEPVTGGALEGLLPNGHPYRQIVEETLATRSSRGPVQAILPSPAGDNGARTDASEADERLLMTHAITGVDGELVGVLLVSRNLSYLTRMQASLAYSRKLVALGRLTAGIAHEVKNPLNAMMIHLELLRTKIRGTALAPARQPEPVAAGGGRVPGPSPVQDTSALEHVRVIESEIRRLDEVVQGFLKFTRPDDLRPQPVRPAAIFDDILPIVKPDAEARGVSVETT